MKNKNISKKWKFPAVKTGMCERKEGKGIELAKNVARTLALELANMELKNIMKNEKGFEATTKTPFV